MALKTLFFIEDIMARYHCKSKDTARRYMHQMGADGYPLYVTEEMINAFDERHRKAQREPEAPMKKGRFAVPKGVRELPDWETAQRMKKTS